ncbi:MAG: response regulator [Anaerolineae bacterium]|nr:response regulator [Anaerolineae bacterium]
MNAQRKVVCLDGQTKQVDPSPTVNHLDTVLENNGFEVVHAPQEQDIHAVCRETPDVVLFDMSDNHRSVWDIYHHIRQSTLTCNIPVIIITNKVTRIEDVMQLYAANAADCLMKPFAPQELVSSINQVLLN